MMLNSSDMSFFFFFAEIGEGFYDSAVILVVESWFFGDKAVGQTNSFLRSFVAWVAGPANWCIGANPVVRFKRYSYVQKRIFVLFVTPFNVDNILVAVSPMSAYFWDLLCFIEPSRASPWSWTWLQECRLLAFFLERTILLCMWLEDSLYSW